MAELRAPTLIQIVEKIFRHQGGWLRLKGELAVYYWPRIAGGELAAKVEAVRYRDGNLYLQTDNPALAHQVSLLNYDIIQRFQKLLGRGVVKNIKIKIAPLTEIHKQKSVPIPVELAETEKSLINDCCNGIADMEMAAPFRNVMQQALLQQRRLLTEQGNTCRSCDTPIEADYTYCPCCERQIHQEIRDYQEYLRKGNQEVAVAADSQTGLAEMHETLIRQILKQDQPSGPDRQ